MPYTNHPSTAPSSIDTTACINYTSTQSITQLHTHMYTHIYMHKYTKHAHNHLGEVGQLRQGVIGVAMNVITVAQRLPLAHSRYIRIHPALLTPHVTNIQHYLHPTLRYETAGLSATHTNTLQCGQLFEQTVRHSSATDITTIKRNRHYCVPALYYFHNQQH